MSDNNSKQNLKNDDDSEPPPYSAHEVITGKYGVGRVRQLLRASADQKSFCAEIRRVKSIYGTGAEVNCKLSHPDQVNPKILYWRAAFWASALFEMPENLTLKQKLSLLDQRYAILSEHDAEVVADRDFLKNYATAKQRLQGAVQDKAIVRDVQQQSAGASQAGQAAV